ncbi:multicopper oxidase [Piedraia hortae CBS 480.64]|uniref:Multicopper oxidase n=1 Tax=Piedraia hortae CBS 480.64 TaxID=1314780 RepID=A0A6A7C1R7_9PEZI|nr:multicopper oxidase [Piedraia hortae CBS 480.64]
MRNRQQIPATHTTRRYNFTVSRGRIAADGVLRDVILVNEQFPGPVIEANWGDWVEVTVNNNISSPGEGTTLHWHGQPLASTPWEDGVSGVSQCPIAPEQSFTYRWRAEAYGTSWYHSHYSAQYAGGVAGPIVIHGPSSAPYDIDIGPVMLSDWYHIPYFAIVKDAVGKNLSVIPPVSDSVLINGRGRFDCSKPSYDQNDESLSSSVRSNLTWQCIDNAPLSRFRFHSGKVHRLRLINHGANGVQKFSIDRHSFTVIANDYVPVVPYSTQVVTLGVGQRADVLVQGLDDPRASVWMRTSAPGGEACGGSNNPHIAAAVYYEKARANANPTSTPDTYYDTTFQCRNDRLDLTRPSYKMKPSKDAVVENIELTLVVNKTGNFEFRVNGQALLLDEGKPIMEHVLDGNTTYDKVWNVYEYNTTKHRANSVIFNLTNNMPLVHPFHLHGHEFAVLSIDGPSKFNSSATPGNTSPTFNAAQVWDGSVQNPNNPMRRDGVLIPPYGYAAVQIDLNNPGIWPFHCHIAWHLSAGQGFNVVYNVDEMGKAMGQTIPDGWFEGTCKAWREWSKNTGQIDAGL